MSDGFWSGKRVFVTGHTGFKGAWLALWLRERGAVLTGYALAPSTVPSLFDAARVGEGITSVLGDVRDLDALQRAVDVARPEIVFHLAAQSLVRPSYDDPVGTYMTNVMGTVHLLEAVRRAPSVRAAVIVTSDKCYRNREWLWAYREEEALGGHDPYSSSKACAELVTESYQRAFFAPKAGTRIATARAGNVIGGGDWARDRLIPDAMRAFGRGDCLTIRNPAATRPWQHVLEALEGYLQLAERLFTDGHDFAEPWNFGPDESSMETVELVVRSAAELWGNGATWALDDGAHPHESGALKVDSSKARARLGWRPRLSLPAALEMTVEWYRAVGGGAEARALTLSQIERYEAMQ